MPEQSPAAAPLHAEQPDGDVQAFAQDASLRSSGRAGEGSWAEDGPTVPQATNSSEI